MNIRKKKIGGVFMSLINNMEKKLIKEVADKLVKIKGNEMLCSDILVQKKEKSTFYKRNDDIKTIVVYSYETPVELKSLLNNNWDLLNDDLMKQFTSVSTISAYKNKMIDLKQGGVSPYIYEF